LKSVPGRGSRWRVVATSRAWSTASSALWVTGLRKPLSGLDAHAVKTQATADRMQIAAHWLRLRNPSTRTAPPGWRAALRPVSHWFTFGRCLNVCTEPLMGTGCILRAVRHLEDKCARGGLRVRFPVPDDHGVLRRARLGLAGDDLLARNGRIQPAPSLRNMLMRRSSNTA
jgi:hypothetical protein